MRENNLSMFYLNKSSLKCRKVIKNRQIINILLLRLPSQCTFLFSVSDTDSLSRCASAEEKKWAICLGYNAVRSEGGVSGEHTAPNVFLREVL